MECCSARWAAVVASAVEQLLVVSRSVAKTEFMSVKIMVSVNIC